MQKISWYILRRKITLINRVIKNQRGLTLPELMVAGVVMILTISGILISYLRCLELSEISKNMTFAVEAVKSKIEQIRSTPFNQIKITYDTISFTAPSLNGLGVSYVNDNNPQLLQVTVSFCWKQSNGRIYGEDKNLNGVINAGEDTNANGILDSPVELVSYIYDR